MAQQGIRRGIRQHCRSMPPQLLHACITDRRVGFLLADVLGQFQFCHVKQGIGVTGKHPRAGCSIHAAFATLSPLAVVVAINHRTAQLRAHLVKLVAEMCHLVSTVFIARDDLVNRVDDDSNVLFFLRPPNQLRGKPVHRFGHATQIPDVNALEIRRRQFHCLIHIPKPMQAAGSVQFQIDIQHTPLCTLPAQPPPALSDGNRHFNECIGFAGFRRPCNQHFVSLPQHVFNERRR